MRTLRCAGLLAIPLALAGCETTVAGSDSTPPELTYYYRVNDALWTEVPASGVEVSAERTDVVHFWVVAKDSGGVKRAAIHAEGLAQCGGGGDPIVLEDLAYEPTSSAPVGTGEGDRTASTRNVTLDFSGSSIECASGDFRNANLKVQASAENFHGGETTSGEVTLSVR